MVGGKERRIPPEDGGDLRMTAEFLIQESADLLPVPSKRVDKIGVEGKVPLVKSPGLQAGGFAAADGHVEDGQVQEGDGRAMPNDEVQGLSGLGKGLRRGAEEQIDIGGNPGSLQGRQRPGDHIQVNALAHGIKNSLVT